MSKPNLFHPDKMIKSVTRFKATFTFIALVVLFSAACSNRVTQSEGVCQPLPDATPVPSITGSGALIVTDISGSMNGFAQQGSVRLFTLHDSLERAIRNAVVNAEPSPAIRRCYLGNSLDCQTQHNLRDFDNPSMYAAKESRLDLFMQAPQKSDGDKQTAEDPIDPYRIAVLVSDGMQASTGKSSSAAPCMAGADPDCMAHLLKQRAKQGYGVWMALLLMPFKGTHYPERPMDNALWEKVQQHVATLTDDPFFRGLNFKVSRAGSGVPFESYQFEGVKPIMVLVLSKDLQAGRNFIQQFADAVKREGLVQPASGLYTMELAPLSVRPRYITEVALSADEPTQNLRPIIYERQPGYYNYQVQCESEGQGVLIITTEEREGKDEVPQGVKALYNLVPNKGGSLPLENITVNSAGEKNFEMRLSCQQIMAGNYESCLDLQAVLKTEPRADIFWSGLNAENMYEAPERLYGLREMIQKVLDQAIAQPRIMDRLYLRVEHK